MPINYADYPRDWKQIRERILARAHNRCEECGVPNGALIVRFEDGAWTDNRGGVPFKSGDVVRSGCKFYRPVRIVLTIAHIDHDITNNDPANLRAWCQLHHLRHDAKHHATNAAATRARKKQEAMAAAGVMRLEF